MLYQHEQHHRPAHCVPNHPPPRNPHIYRTYAARSVAVPFMIRHVPQQDTPPARQHTRSAMASTLITNHALCVASSHEVSMQSWHAQTQHSPHRPHVTAFCRLCLRSSPEHAYSVCEGLTHPTKPYRTKPVTTKHNTARYTHHHHSGTM